VRLDDQRGLGAADVQVGQRKQVTRRQQSNQPVHEIAHAGRVHRAIVDCDQLVTSRIRRIANRPPATSSASASRDRGNPGGFRDGPTIGRDAIRQGASTARGSCFLREARRLA